MFWPSVQQFEHYFTCLTVFVLVIWKNSTWIILNDFSSADTFDDFVSSHYFGSIIQTPAKQCKGSVSAATSTGMFSVFCMKGWCSSALRLRISISEGFLVCWKGFKCFVSTNERYLETEDAIFSSGLSLMFAFQGLSVFVFFSVHHLFSLLPLTDTRCASSRLCNESLSSTFIRCSRWLDLPQNTVKTK